MSSPPPDPPMHAHTRPSRAHARAPTFSVHDFEQLVSDAFDSPPTPTLALTPASPTASGSTSAVSPGGGNPAKSYFEESDDDNARLREPRTSRASRRPRSQSFSSFSVPRALPSSSASTYGELPSRPGMARRVLKTLRTHASALVLRTSTAPISAATGRDTPASFVTLSSRTSTSTVTARPPSRQLSRYAFPSGVEGSTPPDSVGRLGSLDFLRIPPHGAFDGPRSAPTPSVSEHRSKSPNPTLLGDLAISANRCNTPPLSAFARAPSLPPSPPSPPTMRVHTRLPPLKQSRSFHFLSRHDKKLSKKKSSLEPASPVPSSSMAIEFDQGELPSRCPSPYTNPRPPPPVPPKTPAQELWREDDFEQELEVPSYVFERRGSATSESSSASVRSTQTLAERIAKVIPRSLRMAKGRTRSKLNLSVITSSSSDSTPNSFDTSTTFSSSGYSASMPPTPHTSSFGGTSSSRRSSVQSATLDADRVLALEEDPFKKGDIEVPVEVERTRTPMPFDAPPSPRLSRLDRERRVANWAMRKTSSGSGHAHTNSGDTITALTSRVPSPMDADGPERQFVFPPLPARLSPSPAPTPYDDWSPVSLRSNAPLPDLPAHVASISGSLMRSFTPPPPGPPPNIPLPPSPASPSLKRRKSQTSLRTAALVSNKDAAKRLNVERPPSPFPLTPSAASFASWVKTSRLRREEYTSPVSEFGQQKSLPRRSASVRSARSDPGTHACTPAKHARTASEQCHARRASAKTLTEISEERWDDETAHSTAFYSARSSMRSGVSTVFGDA